MVTFVHILLLAVSILTTYTSGLSPIYSRRPLQDLMTSSTAVDRAASKYRRLHPTRFTSRLHASPSDKQAEIAALEVKLRQLKEESQIETNPLDPNSSDDESIVEETEWAVMKGGKNDSIMFSERWKELDTSSNAGGGWKNIALAIGLVVGLAVFSQVPVGNENLQKYQDVKGSSSRIDLGDLNPDVRVQL